MTTDERIEAFVAWLDARCKDLDRRVDAAIEDPHRRDRLKTERAEAETILARARKLLLE